MSVRTLNLLTGGSLIALIALCLSWELWLAPLRPGGSMLVLKVLPLLAPLRGILHGRRYTHQWASLLSLIYIAEGIVRASSDVGDSSYVAMVELAIATLWLAGCLLYIRETRLPVCGSRLPRNGGGT